MANRRKAASIASFDDAPFLSACSKAPAASTSAGAMCCQACARISFAKLMALAFLPAANASTMSTAFWMMSWEGRAVTRCSGSAGVVCALVLRSARRCCVDEGEDGFQHIVRSDG